MKRINRREALKRVAVLMGGTLAAPTVAGVLGGCRAGSSGSWTPAVLSSDQVRTLSALVDRMLPETDTPGALEVGVPEFIDRMMAEWYPEALRARFVEGLDTFDQRTREATGSAFPDLATDQQHELLLELDAESGATADAVDPAEDGGADPYDALAPSVARSRLTDELKDRVNRSIGEAARRTAARRADGGPVVDANVFHEGVLAGDADFYRMLRELTLVGYYTSEVGATEELRFVQVPGRWEGCVPFSEIERTWAI